MRDSRRVRRDQCMTAKARENQGAQDGQMFQYSRTTRTGKRPLNWKICRFLMTDLGENKEIEGSQMTCHQVIPLTTCPFYTLTDTIQIPNSSNEFPALLGSTLTTAKHFPYSSCNKPREPPALHIAPLSLQPPRLYAHTLPSEWPLLSL